MKYGRMLVGAGALTAIGVLVAPGLASAHTADYSFDCEGLSVKVELYPPDTTIKVTIDGDVHDYTGGVNEHYPWDPTKSHHFDIVVTDPQEPEWNRHWSDDQKACVTPPTEPTVPPTEPTVPPTEPTTPPTEPTVPPTEPTTPITQNLVTTTTRASSGGGSSGGGSSSGGGQLPSTGPGDAVPFAAAGIAALAGGSALLYVARRRGSTPS